MVVSEVISCFFFSFSCLTEQYICCYGMLDWVTNMLGWISGLVLYLYSVLKCQYLSLDHILIRYVFVLTFEFVKNWPWPCETDLKGMNTTKRECMCLPPHWVFS